MRTARWHWHRARAALLRPRLVVQTRPVMFDDADRCHDPIFLIGVHRSGTSLVRRMFNSHPNIACPPETFFMKHYAAMLADGQVFDGYAGMGFTRDEALRDLATCAAKPHEAFRLSRGKARWADKTPQYIHILEDLRTLFAPGARFVMIYRDPFDVAYSIHKWGWFTDGFGERGGFEGTLHYVRDMLVKQRAFEDAWPELCTRLRYGDLVHDPRGALTPVLAFLGEDWADRMLHFAELSHNHGAEDLIVQSSRGIVPSEGNWLDWSERKQILAEAALGDLRRTLGFG